MIHFALIIINIIKYKNCIMLDELNTVFIVMILYITLIARHLVIQFMINLHKIYKLIFHS